MIWGILHVCRKYYQSIVINSATGTRTRVTRVRAEYPNQQDYGGSVHLRASGRSVVVTGAMSRDSTVSEQDPCQSGMGADLGALP